MQRLRGHGAQRVPPTAQADARRPRRWLLVRHVGKYVPVRLGPRRRNRPGEGVLCRCVLHTTRWKPSFAVFLRARHAACAMHAASVRRMCCSGRTRQVPLTITIFCIVLRSRLAYRAFKVETRPPSWPISHASVETSRHSVCFGVNVVRRCGLVIVYFVWVRCIL